MYILKYKEYYGSVEYSKEDGCFWGKVLGLDRGGLILYEGNTLEELEQDFKDGVNSYLDCCESHNIDHGISQFTDVHLPVNVFEKINTFADKTGFSLNACAGSVTENPVIA